MADKKADGEVTNNDLLKAIKTLLRSELRDFATKDDLKGFATKDDLKGFATKEDLKSMEGRLKTKFATKDDLKSMEVRLNRKLNSFRRANTQHHLRTREEIGYINSTIGDMRDGLKQATGLS